MFKKFWASRSGNFALMTAGLSIPLLLGVGMAVDYSRYLTAEKHLQEVADAVSLGLASSSERNKTQMILLAQKIMNSNVSDTRIDAVDPIAEDDLTVTADNIDVHLEGNIRTTFMGIAGYNILGVTATSLATRAVNGSVEVALVLDNTWSMSETDAAGVSKISALKTAAGTLIDTLMPNATTSVKISLVPYADYVNVGTANRNKSWLSVGADIPGVAATCVKEDYVVTTACKTWDYKTCQRTVDGVVENYACNTCLVYKDPYWSTRNVCTGGVTAQTWYGCVGSRKTGKTRLDDKTPLVTYPGYVETSQKCLNPIVALTNQKATLKTAVSNMIINIGSYKPYTYIPAGMIWGVNMLSPTEPFSEGLAYDSMNKTPRKAIVLMTDGENTLKFRASDGRHIALSTNAAAAATEYKKVNEETLDICTYAKSQKIEVYTVAFMVDNADARSMLEQCATDKDHYFDASDPASLMTAFSGIAQSLQIVRLAR